MKHKCKKELRFWHIVVSLLAMLLYRYIYECIVKHISKSYLFVYSKYKRIDSLIFLFLIVLFVICIYVEKSKIKNYLTVFNVFAVITVMVIPFCFGVYKADYNCIEKGSIFTNEHLSIKYTDIDSAELYIGSSGWRTYSLSLIYDLHIEKETINIPISQTRFDSYDDIVEFDKRLSDKRSVLKSNFSLDEINQDMSEESKAYYNLLFDGSKTYKY